MPTYAAEEIFVSLRVLVHGRIKRGRALCLDGNGFIVDSAGSAVFLSTTPVTMWVPVPG